MKKKTNGIGLVIFEQIKQCIDIDEAHNYLIICGVCFLLKSTSNYLCLMYFYSNIFMTVDCKSIHLTCFNYICTELETSIHMVLHNFHIRASINQYYVLIEMFLF